MALDEVVPQRRLGRGEILSQKFNQKIFTNHEVSDLIPLQNMRNFIRAFGSTNHRKQISRQVAAVMKIIPLAIIRSPSDKEKINFRRRLSISVDKLECGILGQRACQVRLPTFAANEIREWRGRANVSREIKGMPGCKKDQRPKEIDRPSDTDINIEDTINRQNHQSRNNRQDITNAQIDEQQSIKKK